MPWPLKDAPNVKWHGTALATASYVNGRNISQFAEYSQAQKTKLQKKQKQIKLLQESQQRHNRKNDLLSRSCERAAPSCL